MYSYASPRRSSKGIRGFACRFIFPALVASVAGAASQPPHYLGPETLTAQAEAPVIERLAQDHFGLTGEHLFITVFEESELPGDFEPGPHARNALERLRQIGVSEEERFVLLAVYPSEEEAVIVNDFELDAAIGPAERTEITDSLSEALPGTAPALSRKLLDSQLQLLETLNSPLIETGEAREIVARAGLNEEDPAESSLGVALFFFAAGLLFTGGVAALVSTADVHYSSEGMSRSHPLTRQAGEWLARARSGGAPKAREAPVPPGGVSGNW